MALAPKVSIVVPTYEYGGEASFYLRRLFESIKSQTFREFEVVVSDHSRGDSVSRFCDSQDLRVVYLRNIRKRGNSSANMNYGLRNASGEILKIMHMDDFFSSDIALELIVESFKNQPDKSWGVLGFASVKGKSEDLRRPTVPSLATTLGCPSVSFFRTNDSELDTFDESLIVMNDHDFHQRLLFRYGRPIVIPEICVGIGVTSLRVSAGDLSERLEFEQRYFGIKRELILQNIQREYEANESGDFEVRPIWYQVETRANAGFSVGIRSGLLFLRQIRDSLRRLRLRTLKIRFRRAAYAEITSFPPDLLD